MSLRSKTSVRTSRRPFILGLSSLLSTAVISSVACSVEPVPTPAPTEGQERADAAPAAGSTPNPSASEAQTVAGSEPKNGYLRALVSLGDCTGVFLKTSEDPKAPAYVLTAGRCIKGFDQATYFDVGFKVELREGGSVTFDFLGSPADQQPQVPYVHAAYVTLKGSDVALVELASTIGHLHALGIEPLSLAHTAPSAGVPIEMVGLPFKQGQMAKGRELRRARCAEGARRPEVVEHYSYWHDLHVNDCPELGAGATGSPALDHDGRVYGVFNTRFSRVEPQQPCYVNYPCEVGAGEEHGVEGANYVVDATGFANCFDADGRFDVKVSGCQLDAGIGAPPIGSGPRIAPPTYGEPPVSNTWGLILASTKHTHYRSKVGAVRSVNCRSPEGYSEPLPISDGGLEHLVTPAQDGFYALCVVTGSGDVDSTTWQSFAYPTVLVRKVQEGNQIVDPETPDLTAEQVFALSQQVMGAYRDHAKAHGARYSLQFGPVDGTDIFLLPDHTWRVWLGLDFRRNGISADVATFILCHEVGHTLGGYPFKGVRAQPQAGGIASGLYGTVLSAEGNSDYFASKECLPRIWADQRALNAKFRERVSDYVRARCDEVWREIDEQNLCYRSLAAAEAFGRWLVVGKLDPVPKLETPDPTVVEKMDSGYPKHAQCRVDTILRGALCRTKFRGTAIPGLVEPFDQVWLNPPASEAAAALDSCVEGPASRPACWFMPNRTAPADCTGIPVTGACGEHDGVPVMLTCDAENGIMADQCTPGYVCQIDEEYGWPKCVRAAPTQP